MEPKMTDGEMLKYALESGIIDINTLQMQIEMNERKKYLDMHKNKVWQGSNGYYYTKVEDKSKKDGRRTIKKKTVQELEDEIVKHYRNTENEPTIEDVFKEWLEQKLKYGEIQRQTVERYEVDFNRFFVCTGFHRKKIAYIEEYDLEDFIKTSIHSKKLTAKAWSNLRTLLNGIFKYAKKRGYTALSISSFLGDLDISKKSFAKTIKPDEQCVFSDLEMAKILEYLNKNSSIGNLGVILAAYTGMRVGEVVALKWEDVKEDYIYVHRMQIRYHGEDGKEIYEIRDSPKTDAGIRKVVIVDRLKPVLKRLKMLTPFSEYIFTKNGKIITKHVLDMCIYRACEHTGIPRRGMHVLRKTYATRLINSHIDDAIIINQMGHTDIETTRGYYYYNDKTFDAMSKSINKAINF